MIRVFLLLLAAMAGTGYLANSIKQKGPGYVYVYFNQYSLETSFWFALLLLAGVVAGLFVLLKLFSLLAFYLVKIGYLPRFFWMGRAKKLRYQGTLAFLNQQWSVSGKKLGKAGKNSETPFLDYLMAARASLAANNIEAACNNMALARQAADFDAASFDLLELDIAIADGKGVNRQQAIQALLDKPGNKAPVVSRAIAFYRQQQQWQLVRELLPLVKKHKVLSADEYANLLADMAKGLMPLIKLPSQRKELKALWKSVAKVQNRSDVLAAYCRALMAIQDDNDACKIIEQHLQQQWSDVLISLYGELDIADKTHQLEFAENFLSHHANNAVLLLTLGYIAKNNGYLAKARDYLLRSLQRQPSVKAYEWLADIAVIQQDLVQAQSLLRQALALAVKSPVTGVT